MNTDSHKLQDDSPILLIPYMWIGDFVRCHSVVKLLRERFPRRPIDMLATSLCAPLTDYMPGVRRAIIADLPRKRLGLGHQRELADRLRREGYGTALIMPRTWKSALAPYLAGIPERIGFFGEARYFLLSDVRYGERKLPRMIDRCGALALPADTALPADWPLPELKVPGDEIEAWRRKRGLTDPGPVVALAPGAVRPFEALAGGKLRRTDPKAHSAGIRGLGTRRSRREAISRRNRRRYRSPRSDRHRSARRHSGAGRGHRGGVERFRSGSRRGGGRHAVDRHIRADQPLALGSAQSAGRHHRNHHPPALPALPQAGLPARPPSLHARHPARTGPCGRPAGARRRRAAITAHTAGITACLSNPCRPDDGQNGFQVMTILVTGGAGYIGSQMVRELTDAGESVVVLDNLSTGHRWAVAEGVPLVIGETGDQPLVTKLIREHNIEAIIHFAASIVVPDSVRDPLELLPQQHRQFAQPDRMRDQKRRAANLFFPRLPPSMAIRHRRRLPNRRRHCRSRPMAGRS